jgi:hypothetical protein
MNIPITSQHLDSAWNRYLEADERRLEAFTLLVGALVAGDVAALEPARKSHTAAVLEMREAARAIRLAQADLLTILSLRTSELRDMQVGLQVEAGLAARVEVLDERLNQLEAILLPPRDP